MQTQSDLLAEVVDELNRRHGDLPKVARESGVLYDTVLRIKNRENDPGYSKVKALHTYLFGAANDDPPAQKSPSDAKAVS